MKRTLTLLFLTLMALSAWAAPEIALSGSAINITNGDTIPSPDDYTDFEGVYVSGGSATRDLTITNNGATDLTLTGTPMVVIGGPNAADFTVIAQPDVSVLAAGESTIFVIKFDPSAAGLRTATLSIASDDADENPFTFAIQGMGIIPTVTASTASILPTATTLTISGTGFSTTPEENTVAFTPSGTTGTVTSLSGLHAAGADTEFAATGSLYVANDTLALDGSGTVFVTGGGVTTAVSGSGVYLPKSKTFWGMFNGIGVAGRVELAIP